MGTFELDRERGFERNERRSEFAEEPACEAVGIDRRRIKEECIIAFKVYDHCRQPDCV